MAIDVRELSTRTLDPAIAEELDTYERTVGEYLDGRVDEDVFRVFRLNNGVYGQRQGGHNQMLRIKVPYGKLTPEQLETCAYIGDTYSRGWGHLTTRQNVQFHFVELEKTPEILRLLASVGLTSREACGDTVRNVMGCHLAGACPQEKLDITPWAEATARWLLRHPYAQRLPRKFKINFSGCATDCGQAMFNDVGVIGTTRTLDDGTVEPGFKVFVAGGLGANPHAAQALEEFTAREDLLPTIEACLRTFDHYGNRDNKIRARMKWLVDTMGIEELRERVLKERKFLRAARGWPGGIPAQVREQGDAPAGGESIVPTGTIVGVPVKLTSNDPYSRWQEANVVRGVAKGTISVMAYARLGDITTQQWRDLADIQRDFNLDVRVTNRQNFALRDVTEADLRGVYDRLVDTGMAEPGAELARDVVACPGADTCNLAVTQSRGLAAAIGDALEDSRPRRGPGRAHQHLRLHEQLRPAPHLRHRLLRSRTPRPRSGGTGLPDAARRSRRRHADRVRRQGFEAAGQVGTGSGRAGRAPVQRRTRSRRDLPALARTFGWRQGRRSDPHRSRPVPHSRRRTRLLRRLRRDRSLRRGNRRQRVRNMTVGSKHATPPKAHGVCRGVGKR